MIDFFRRVIRGIGLNTHITLVPHLKESINNKIKTFWRVTGIKTMNLKTKIAVARMDLEKKRNVVGEYRKLTIKERFWKWVNESRFVLATTMLTLGASWMFVYFEGKAFYNEVLPMRNETIAIYNQIQTPIAEAKTIDKVEEKIEEVKKSDKVILLRRAIYQLESSSGTKGTDQGCKAKGLVNGYGLNPGSCYKNGDEVAGLVEHWIQRHIDEGMTDSQLLCHYNTGTPSDDCQYYQDYLRLN